MQNSMTEDNPDTKNDKWTQLVARVTAWLLEAFWVQNDDRQVQFAKTQLENCIEFGTNGSDEDRKTYTTVINSIIRRYRDTCPLPSTKSQDPTVNEIWDMMMDNPNRLLALFTLREGEVKAYGEASKIGLRRIKRMLKEQNYGDAGVSAETFITNFDASLVAYPVKKEETSMDEEA